MSICKYSYIRAFLKALGWSSGWLRVPLRATKKGDIWATWYELAEPSDRDRIQISNTRMIEEEGAGEESDMVVLIYHWLRAEHRRRAQLALRTRSASAP